MKPKNWILEKNLSDSELQAIRVGDPEYKIEKETEKAYKFKIMTDFGNIYTWCPKSQVEEEYEFEEENPTTEEHYKLANELCEKYNLDDMDYSNYSLAIDVAKGEVSESKLQDKANKMHAGLEYNMKLREVLNANGIKTSMKRRISNATLIDKIKSAGLEVPAR